jgi:hypothetical protein
MQTRHQRMANIKRDSGKLDLQFSELQRISNEFSSDKSYCFRVNSTRNPYMLRKIYPLVTSKYSQYKISQNWSHPKNTSHNRFYNVPNSDLVLYYKNHNSKITNLFACKLVAFERYFQTLCNKI